MSQENIKNLNLANGWGSRCKCTIMENQIVFHPKTYPSWPINLLCMHKSPEWSYLSAKRRESKTYGSKNL